MGTRAGAEWGRKKSAMARERFKIVRIPGAYRVLDTSTGEFVGVARNFSDATEVAYDLAHRKK